MPQPLPITSKARKSWAVDPDGPVRWGCSGKGWNCCVGVGIAVRPYDMLRLRHAAGRPAQDLVNDATVTFEWEPASGILNGRLAHRPYEQAGRPSGQDGTACVFLDELTNLDVRRIRDDDPQRFAGLPPGVQRHADARADREWKVAGLCGVHSGRPEVCRGFPYQRLPAHDGAAAGSEVHQLFRCGSCAHAAPTTPRAILEGESLDEHWRADDAFRQICRYLHARGVANPRLGLPSPPPRRGPADRALGRALPARYAPPARLALPRARRLVARPARHRGRPRALPGAARRHPRARRGAGAELGTERQRTRHARRRDRAPRPRRAARPEARAAPTAGGGRRAVGDLSVQAQAAMSTTNALARRARRVNADRARAGPAAPSTRRA